MCSSFSTTQIAVQNAAFSGVFVSLLMKIILFLWSVALAMAILDLISGVHLA
jgi:hypothetical protein